MTTLELRLHNTLTNRREVFSPRRADAVRMYVCGPTVYGPVHVGNARPAVVFDLLCRLLRRRYRRVIYARNITDIDDKIIAAAVAAGESPAALALRWRMRHAEDIEKLGVASPDIEPLATDNIFHMQQMIARLIEREFAYVAEGHALFHVPAFADYGALSNRRRDEILAGARVEVAPYKRDAADFVLWKPAAHDEPGWASPWGRGRPGWHIECSAMAAACLGEEIDIHGGGQDLIFPHHENELAQSRCAHGTQRFARYWLHNGHVHFGGEKMSKSLGNIRLLQDALAQYPGEAIRLALLTAHYRQPLNWSDQLLRDSRAVLDRWHRVAEGPVDATAKPPPAVEMFLADDLNTPAAIAACHAAANAIADSRSTAEEAKTRGAFVAGANLLGLLRQTAENWFQGGAGDSADDEERIRDLMEKRAAARARRDYAAADAARAELSAMGIVLEDGADGATAWRRA